MDASSAAAVTSRRPGDAFDVLEPLLAIGGWVRFLAWLSIAGGVAQCLSIVGAIVGWIPIWIGVLLLRGLERLELGVASDQPGELREGVRSLAKAVQVHAILALIGLAVSALATVLALLFVLGLVVAPAAMR